MRRRESPLGAAPRESAALGGGAKMAWLEPTCELRWQRREPDDDCPEWRVVLQQKWLVTNDGQLRVVEWRDVPTVVGP